MLKTKSSLNFLSPKICQIFNFHDIASSSSDFYPRDAMLARVIAIETCLSVRHAPVLCQNEER